MSVNKLTDFGKIKVSNNAVASIVADATNECYGVVGICDKDFEKNKGPVILDRKHLTDGIIIKTKKEKLEISLYIIVVSGMKVTEILRSIQKKVKYVVEKTLDISVGKVNVYVQCLKKVD